VAPFTSLNSSMDGRQQQAPLTAGKCSSHVAHCACCNTVWRTQIFKWHNFMKPDSLCCHGCSPWRKRSFILVCCLLCPNLFCLTIELTTTFQLTSPSWETASRPHSIAFLCILLFCFQPTFWTYGHLLDPLPLPFPTENFINWWSGERSKFSSWIYHWRMNHNVHFFSTMLQKKERPLNSADYRLLTNDWLAFYNCPSCQCCSACTVLNYDLDTIYLSATALASLLRDSNCI